ncbi:MAG: serine/threonine-protein kinase [Deltaproteobacteria bacterium]|nr:serine/threonine-protein kinase [Deltaproteobacteria bacterium]
MKVGQTIGGCEIVEEIGAGGMAVVFRAVQTGLGRSVAIKFLKREHLESREMVQRFRREAKSVASLQHENIVSIYDFQEAPEGLGMILEYVSGTDLHDLLARCYRLPPDVAAIIGLKVCCALEYAHYRKVVHRDIKPSNIMISWSGEVKLTDFGIAKDMLFDDLTRTGMAIGTPSYMSPEQVVGAKLDSKSDLFSFGILLYQMLTGERPFTDDDEGTVLAKIRDEDYLSPRRINADIPLSLERIVKRCLQKKPEERYASTALLRQDLEREVADRVTTNYSARLVTYLANRGFIELGEARALVDPEVLASREIRRVDLGGPPSPSVWEVPLLSAGALLLLSLWVALLHGGVVGPGGAAALPSAPPGEGRAYLKVVADPWAHVYVDGAFFDTTPFAREIALPSGPHEVTLKNDFLGEKSVTVDLKAGAHQVLREKLEAEK